MMQPKLVPHPAAAPNTSALKMAEWLLERVRSGEIIEFAIIEVGRDRKVATAWSAGEHYHLLNSGAARLASQLARED